MKTRKNKKLFYALTVILLLAPTACSPKTEAKQVEEDSLSTKNETPISVKNSLTVNGASSVKTEPDIAIIHLGVHEKSSDVKDGQKKVDEKIKVIKATLLKLGIKEEDIQTEDLYIHQDYDNQGNPSGYNIAHDLKITVRKIDNAGKILDAAIENGANNSRNIELTLSKAAKEKFYNDALKLAIKNAEEKASYITDKKEMPKPLKIIENGCSNNFTNYLDMMKSESMESSSIEKGTLDITANVTVIYEN